ncbi:MAG: YciI family protein [Acidobacteria bacterium]|nr:YciI family protein [Acidobacteriota bacterium]
MKYMLMVYGAEDAWTEEEREQCMSESRDLCHELDAAGRFLAASPLQSVSTATSVRIREGRRLVTDGPFAETTEQLGGFYLVEAADLDEAIAIAERIPGASVGTVEIRPPVELSGLPGMQRSRDRPPDE